MADMDKIEDAVALLDTKKYSGDMSKEQEKKYKDAKTLLKKAD